MVTQQNLDLLFQVRVLAGQPGFVPKLLFGNFAWFYTIIGRSSLGFRKRSMLSGVAEHESSSAKTDVSTEKALNKTEGGLGL